MILVVLNFDVFVFFFNLYSLGVAYAGTNKEDVLSLILQVLGDSTINMEVFIDVVDCNLLLPAP